MLVRLRSKEGGQSQDWPPFNKRIHASLAEGSSSEEPLWVLGIIFAKERTILILPIPNVDDIMLADASLFDVIDNSSSRHWIVNCGVSKINVAYDDVDFRNFAYVGIDRLVAEEDFFEKYWSEENNHIEYNLRMRDEIRREAFESIKS